MAFLWLLYQNDFRRLLWCKFICGSLFSIHFSSAFLFVSHPFPLFTISTLFSHFLAHSHGICTAHYAFPIHLIKIRQNEKCDMSIYFLVSNIGYCSVAVCMCLMCCAVLCSVPCYKSYVMLGCKKATKRMLMLNVQCSMAVWVCVCYAKHMPYILVFYLISIPQWIGCWYIRSIYEIKTSTLFQRLFVCVCECGFVVTKHIAVISAFPRSGIFCLVHFGFCYSFFMFWSQALMGLIFLQLFTVRSGSTICFQSHWFSIYYFLHLLTCFAMETMACEKYMDWLDCIRWTKHFRNHISLWSIFRISQNA